MCGRIVTTGRYDGHRIREDFGDIELATNADVRPTQPVEGFAIINGHPSPLTFHWGIKPGWAKQLLINAKAETVASLRTFKDAFAHRRCLVPVAGWYEWRESNGHKQRFYFHCANRPHLLMAGIWWPPTEGHPSFGLVTLTQAPTPQCREYHNRMPVLIGEDNAAAYLENTSWAQQLIEQHVQVTLTIEPTAGPVAL